MKILIHFKPDSIGKCKFHMVNWPADCRPKDCGGLGLTNTKFMNKALMLKWVWKLYQEEDPI